MLSENDITSVWLIGSQADGSAAPESDWDILVFSNKEPTTVKQRHEKVDVIRVGLSGLALLEGQSINTYTLDFKKWKWYEVNKEIANYEGYNKSKDLDDVRNTNDPLFEDKIAFCLWHRLGENYQNIRPITF